MKRLVGIIFLIPVLLVGLLLIYNKTHYYKGLTFIPLENYNYLSDANCPESTYIDPDSLGTLVIYCKGNYIVYDISQSKATKIDQSTIRLNMDLVTIQKNTRGGYKVGHINTGGAGGMSPNTNHYWLENSAGVKVFEFDNINSKVLFAGVLNQKKYFIIREDDNLIKGNKIKLAVN